MEKPGRPVITPHGGPENLLRTAGVVKHPAVHIAFKPSTPVVGLSRKVGNAWKRDMDLNTASVQTMANLVGLAAAYDSTCGGPTRWATPQTA